MSWRSTSFGTRASRCGMRGCGACVREAETGRVRRKSARDVNTAREGGAPAAARLLEASRIVLGDTWAVLARRIAALKRAGGMCDAAAHERQVLGTALLEHQLQPQDRARKQVFSSLLKDEQGSSCAKTAESNNKKLLIIIFVVAALIAPTTTAAGQLDGPRLLGFWRGK